MVNVNNATNFNELLNLLRQAEAEAPKSEGEGEAVSVSDHIDMPSLPVFGGDEPADTSGVWSWDETNLLVGACIGTGEFADDVRIIPG